uniref:Glutathione S-transferase theta 1 n=1 Tax=Heortia vitessoides TaxID=1557813 RepID=A0A3G1RJ82_9NEOP|nr:glutathione S-transferase theta 1 [Heortia vitessoides]
MNIKLYYDLMSQPSRSLYILLKSVNCNFEPKYVDLRKAEHYSEEFSKVNRIQRVPVIDHDGFILSESVAIIKYLARENIIPEKLYPRDSKLQARVDEFLEWHHIGLRLHCAMYTRVMFLDPVLDKSRKQDPKTAANYKGRMMDALETFDTKWLGQGREFIAGNTLTVADLFAASELEQPRLADFNPMQEFPAIGAWAQKVRAYFNPHYDEAHVIVNKIVDKRKLAAKL